jgi:hypothetical protein
VCDGAETPTVEQPVAAVAQNDQVSALLLGVVEDLLCRATG